MEIDAAPLTFSSFGNLSAVPHCKQLNYHHFCCEAWHVTARHSHPGEFITPSSPHAFLCCSKRPSCTCKLCLSEPRGVCPCCEEGLQLSLEAGLLMGKSLGLGLPADSHFHQHTQAAAESTKLQADFLCAARLTHSRVMPHRGAKTSCIKHLLANPIVRVQEPAPVSGGQIQQNCSGAPALGCPLLQKGPTPHRELMLAPGAAWPLVLVLRGVTCL